MVGVAQNVGARPRGMGRASTGGAPLTTASDHTGQRVTRGGETRLKRVLGLPSLVLFGLAYMVPLTAWTTYGVVTTTTEGHLPSAYIVTTVAMLFTA